MRIILQSKISQQLCRIFFVLFCSATTALTIDCIVCVVTKAATLSAFANDAGIKKPGTVIIKFMDYHNIGTFDLSTQINIGENNAAYKNYYSLLEYPTGFAQSVLKTGLILNLYVSLNTVVEHNLKPWQMRNCLLVLKAQTVNKSYLQLVKKEC